jgi:MFS family permease
MSEIHGRARLVGILAASGVSVLGSRMSFVAIPWLVLVTTGSPTQMGLVAGAEMLPYVLVSSLGGPLIDRLGIRRTAVVADLVSAAVMVGIATMYSMGPALLLALVAVAGGLRGFGDTAKKVLVPPRAAAADVPLPRVVAAFDTMSRLSMLVGASVAGIVIAWLGVPAAILVDAVSFAVAAVLVVYSIRPTARASAKRPPAEPYWTALRVGFTHVWHDKIMFVIFAMLFGINVFNQAAGVIFVPLWADENAGTAAAVGFILGAVGLGAVVGGIAFTVLVTRIPRYAVFTLGFLLGGPPRFLTLGLSDDVLTIVVVWFLSGIALAAINPTIGTLMVERTPPELHARVFGLNTAVAWAGIPLGGLVGGWMVLAFGLMPGLVLTGLLYLAIALVPVVWYRGWRAIGQPPQPRPAETDAERIDERIDERAGAPAGDRPAPAEATS